MYKLYYSPGACSKAPHIALHEIGAEHQAIRVQLHGPSGPDQSLLAVNPRLQVPVLDDNGQIIREGAAILIYLCDKHKSALLPQSGPERARALEWLCYFNASVHPSYGASFGAKGIYGEGQVADAILQKLNAKIQKQWDDVEQHLAKNKFLAGDNITIGDVLMTVIGQWNVPGFKNPINLGPNTQRVFDAVKSRPSWQQATEMEQSDAKAAA
ncbi:MAG TPA: glutathione S-transferase family protein [Alphaproteobacteria bacterium]